MLLEKAKEYAQDCISGKEITTFEQINTNITKIPIPIAASTLFVVASVGHIPNKDTNIGFSAIIPFKKFCLTYYSSSKESNN